MKRKKKAAVKHIAKVVKPIAAAVKDGVAGSCPATTTVVGQGCALDMNHAGDHAFVLTVPVK